MEKKSLLKYIERFKGVHGEKYEYPLYYELSSKPITVICKEHGPFNILIYNHLRGTGCPTCRIKETPNRKLEKWIHESNIIHCNKYDYSKAFYSGSRGKVVIICPVHGEFKQFAESHKKGHGCMDCYSESITHSQEQVLSDFYATHGQLYDYSLVNYKSAKSKVKILCMAHGLFEMTPNSHKLGKGCPKCSSSKGELAILNFLKNNKIYYEREWIVGTNPVTGRNMFSDFYIPSLTTVIEFDGKQHSSPVKHFGGEDTYFKVVYRDQIKDSLCEDMMINVIRIPHTDIDNIYDILHYELLGRLPFHEMEELGCI